jgi:P63C domain-containing protein
MHASKNASKVRLMDKRKDESKAIGGRARAAKLTAEERKAIGKKAAATRWDKAKDIPQADYPGKITIGDMVFPCSVLSDGTRILTQSDFMSRMGMYYSGWVSANRSAEDLAADIPQFLAFKSIKPFVDKHLGDLQSITVTYRTERGAIARGIRAEIIPKICDVWLDAAEFGSLGKRQVVIAQKAKLIMRALAHVGIIALVDEATGYQAVRAKNDLAMILQEFIAKELQPYVPTFPAEYYEHMFRLRGLDYPTGSVKRPQYFGTLTNDIVYKRLAPGVLAELKKVTPRRESGKHKEKLFQRLTSNKGYPKLTGLLGSVVTIMTFSTDWHDFMGKLNGRHPRYGEQMSLPFDYQPDTDDGRGL